MKTCGAWPNHSGNDKQRALTTELFDCEDTTLFSETETFSCTLVSCLYG